MNFKEKIRPEGDLTLIFQRKYDISEETVETLWIGANNFTNRNISVFEKYKIAMGYIRFLAICAYWKQFQIYPNLFKKNDYGKWYDYEIIDLIENNVSETIPSWGDNILADVKSTRIKFKIAK